MTYEEFYGSAFADMQEAERQLLKLISLYSKPGSNQQGDVVYCRSRLKTPESMMKKLEGHGRPTTGQAALAEMFDAVGVRAVCNFVDEVYQIVNWLKEYSGLEVVREKDYFAHPKDNGYRSYHLSVYLLDLDGHGKRFPAEIQVRTITTDFWATLEHQVKYKKELPDAELIQNELKHCADKIASIDLSMQKLRERIENPLEKSCLDETEKVDHNHHLEQAN